MPRHISPGAAHCARGAHAASPWVSELALLRSQILVGATKRLLSALLRRNVSGAPPVARVASQGGRGLPRPPRRHSLSSPRWHGCPLRWGAPKLHKFRLEESTKKPGRDSVGFFDAARPTGHGFLHGRELPCAKLQRHSPPSPERRAPERHPLAIPEMSVSTGKRTCKSIWRA